MGSNNPKVEISSQAWKPVSAAVEASPNLNLKAGDWVKATLPDGKCVRITWPAQQAPNDPDPGDEESVEFDGFDYRDQAGNPMNPTPPREAQVFRSPAPQQPPEWQSYAGGAPTNVMKTRTRLEGGTEEDWVVGQPFGGGPVKKAVVNMNPAPMSDIVNNYFSP